MTMNHPVAGEVKVLGHANRYDGQPVPLRRLPPELGREHDRAAKGGRIFRFTDSGDDEAGKGCVTRKKQDK